MKRVKEVSEVPSMYRNVEKYINVSEKGWERRYKEENKSDASNYVKGIYWMYKYYKGECKDWRWKYEGSAPLIEEIIKALNEPEENLERSPLSKEEQLKYVMNTDRKKYNWSYKKYLWESHLEPMPIIDIR